MPAVILADLDRRIDELDTLIAAVRTALRGLDTRTARVLTAALDEVDTVDPAQITEALCGDPCSYCKGPVLNSCDRARGHNGGCNCFAVVHRGADLIAQASSTVLQLQARIMRAEMVHEHPWLDGCDLNRRDCQMSAFLRGEE